MPDLGRALHQCLLDVIKDEFDRRGRADITCRRCSSIISATRSRPRANSTAVITSAPTCPTTSRSSSRWAFDHQRLRVDRRVRCIKLTHRALGATPSMRSTRRMCGTVEQVGGISADEFSVLNKALHRLEWFWTDQIFYRL